MTYLVEWILLVYQLLQLFKFGYMTYLAERILTTRSAAVDGAKKSRQLIIGGFLIIS